MGTGNRKKIIVMHIVECAGGVDRYLKGFLKYLDHSRFENILVCSQNYRKEEFTAYTDFIEQIHMVHNISFGEDRKTVGALRKLIKQYMPDIVYAHSSKAGALTRLANMGIDNQCVYNPHGWAFNMQVSKKKKLFYQITEKILSVFCERIVCISLFEKQSALTHNICKEQKLKVVFNGIDIIAIESKERQCCVTRESLHIDKDAFVVGMVGRLSQQKAPDIFIRMAHYIMKTIPNAYFLMVGDGEMENEVRAYAEENGFADRLYITGWVDNPTDYIELFDVATLLSRWEGFGLVIPEYMICEKPVVATEVDAIPNIIQNGVNGMLVPVDDWQKAGQVVTELCHDRTKYDRLAQQGRTDVYQKYDIRRVAREHEQIFEELMK